MTPIRYKIITTLSAILLFHPFPPSLGQVNPSSDGENTSAERRCDGVGQNNPDDIETLAGLYDQWTTRGEFLPAIMFVSDYLAKKGKEATDDMLLISYANLGQWYLAADSVEKAKYWLDRSVRLMEVMPQNLENVYYRTAVSRVYNSLGIYSVNIDMDYHKGISYFLKGFEIAEEYGDRSRYTTLGCNLVVTYFLRNDPSGLQYALQIYDYGKKAQDRYVTFCGAYVTSIMYYITPDYPEALRYAEEAVSLMDKFYDEAGVYNMYANILLGNDLEQKAEEYYTKALEMVPHSSSTTTAYIYLSYGEYLMGKKEYLRAADVFLQGVAVSRDNSNIVFKYRLYKNLSDDYRSMGDPYKALDYYVLFHAGADSVFNIERERSISELMVRYEAEKKGREIEQGKLKLEREHRRFQTIVFILCIIVVILGAIYILYRHKNRLYIQLLRKHQESLGNEQMLKRKLEKMVQEYDSKGKGPAPFSPAVGGTENRSEEIYARLDELMKTEHSYRQRDLTVEKVAKMIGTNRTYLSKAINEKTALSFNYYINSYRIQEAVWLLSDPGNDIPLKTLSYELGFHSLSTFYKLFNDVVGMPPSKFREKAVAGQAESTDKP